MNELRFIFIAIFLAVLFNLTICEKEKQQTVKNIPALACTALVKRMTKTQSEKTKFNNIVNSFIQVIKQDVEYIRSFVNLLILNHCLKTINIEDAGVIIKESTEKDFNSSNFKHLNLDNCFRDFVKLDTNEKNHLYEEIGEVKKQLRELSQNLGDITKNKESKKTNKSKKNKKSSTTDSELNEEESNSLIFDNILKYFKYAFTGITSIITQNLNALLIAGFLVIIVTILTKKRFKKKVKKENLKNN